MFKNTILRHGLFFQEDVTYLTPYSTRYGIKLIRFLEDANADADDQTNLPAHSFFVGAIDFGGNVHIFKLNSSYCNFTHISSIYGTKESYYTDFIWWSRSKTQILLVTNLGVVDIYDFSSSESVLWGETNVSACQRALFSLDLGYACVISREKSIDCGSYNYSTLQSVNKFSLLDKFVRNGDLEQAERLAADFHIHRDYIYKARWKYIAEKYTVEDVNEILKHVEDCHWVLECCCNYIEDNHEVISALLKRCFEIIHVEEVSTMPKFIHKVIINENSELPEATVTLDSEKSSSEISSEDDNSSKDGWSDDDDMDWSDDESDSGSESRGKSNVMGESSPANENVNSMNEKHFDVIRGCFSDHEKIEHIYVRLKFLKYKYRLRCYLHLKALNVGAENLSQTLTWAFFRDCDVVDFAFHNCKKGNFSVVSTLFQFCWEELHQHRLSILSSIPDTFPINEYSYLLPYWKDVQTDNGSVRAPPYTYRDHKSGQVCSIGVNNQFENDIFDDWAMNEYLLKLPGSKDENGTHYSCKDNNENLKWAEVFFDSHQESGESPSCDANLLAAWYANRSYAMENRSGQLSNALELCILGLDLFDCASLDYNSFADEAYDEFSVDSRDLDGGYYSPSQSLSKADEGFKSLAEAYVKLSSLEKLVYDTTSLALETSLSTVTLKHWLNIPNTNKLELILRGTTPDQAVGRIKDTIFCWMGLRKEEAVSDCERRWVDVLVRYMKKIANNTDGFKTCVAIIKSCNLMETKHAIIREPTTLIETCLSCIYSCPFPLPEDAALLDDINNELFNGMNDIFNMVPVVTKSMVKDYPEIIELDKSVDRLKCHLDALEILHGYKLAPSMKFFSAFETAISSSGNEVENTLFIWNKEKKF